MGERLHQPPGAPARAALGLAETSPPPSHWSLRTIRASVDALAAYSLSGVWRLLHRLQLRRRAVRDQLYSPDPDYLSKVAHLDRCLREAAREPEAVVLLVLDERGYSRWPEGAANDWRLAGPGVAPDQGHKAGPTNRQQRLIGARTALTGRVDDLDNYLVGREQVSAFYRRLDHRYPTARRL